MRIGLKLTAAFLTIASLVGAAGYLARGTTQKVGEQMERLSRSALVNVADTTEMTVALYAGQLTAHELVSAERHRRFEDGASARRPGVGDMIETYQQTIEQALTRQRLASESLVRWAAQRGADEIAQRERTVTLPALDQLEQQFAAHQQLMEEFLEIVDDDPEQAQRCLESRLCPHFQDRLLPLLATHRQRAEKEVTEGIRTAERAMAVADQRRGLLLVAAAAAAVLMGLFTSRSIGKPLGALQRAAVAVGSGRFETRVAIRSRDEIGVLASAINRMAADLNEKTVSKSYLDNIIQSMREMLIVTDPQLRIRRANSATSAELGYAEAELTGRPLRELFASDGLPSNAELPEALAPGLECLMKDKSGEVVPVLCSAAEMHGEQGEPEGVVCVATNISPQKETEQRLLASLREKELLLKEVHHRVKNNLQVISSLLNLQAQELHDPLVIRRFEESQGRIRSMALIHEQLYRSDNLARIDFAAYVEELTGHLRQGLGIRANPIRIRLEVQPVLLPLDLAIPCGMIVNELVSNALEHAFPDNRAGEIRVELTLDDDGCCLRVADDGVGIRAGLIGDEGASIGLKVVQALARQIHGKIEVQRDEGTAFALRFPGPECARPPDADA